MKDKIRTLIWAIHASYGIKLGRLPCLDSQPQAPLLGRNCHAVSAVPTDEQLSINAKDEPCSVRAFQLKSIRGSRSFSDSGRDNQ